MRLTAFTLLLFFVCLNVTLYLINETAILPSWEQSPYETPTGIIGRLVHVDVSAENLLIGGVTLSVFFILSWVAGHLIFGGTVAIILFAMNLLFPIVKWVVFGLPSFLSQMVDISDPRMAALISVLTALIAVVWCWFLLGFVAQRSLEEW